MSRSRKCSFVSIYSILAESSRDCKSTGTPDVSSLENMINDLRGNISSIRTYMVRCIELLCSHWLAIMFLFLLANERDNKNLLKFTVLNT